MELFKVELFGSRPEATSGACICGIKLWSRGYGQRQHQVDGRWYFAERELILDWSETLSLTSPAAVSAM